MYPRKTKNLLCILLPCLVLSSCSGQDPKPIEPGCDVTLFVPETTPAGETEVMVPMSDCVRLSTDIYLPTGTGPFPTILVRIPYDKEKGMEDVALMKILAFVFTRAGYAVVIQDTRGRFDSEGEWNPFLYEQRDGMDTIRWVEVQPWFDGNLGLFGGSYFGFTQLAAAYQRPACLRAMVPLVISSNVYSYFFESGLVKPDLTVDWSMGMAKMDGSDKLPYDEFEKAALHWPLSEADELVVGHTPYFDEWLSHPFNDGFWDRYLPSDAMERIDVPILMLSGWYDIFLTGQLADFETARAREAQPGNVRIIVGPWTHTMGFFEAHDYRFRRPKSIVSFAGRIVQWFDRWLKGGQPGREWGPVTIYDPGAGSWSDQPDLWSDEREERAFFLQGDQGAAACLPAGRLADGPAGGASSIRYTYDPRNPVVRFGGPLLGMPAGCLLEEAGCDRPDILTFVSDSLTKDLTIEGEISLELPVSSSAPDTAFIGRLSLLEPNGKAYILRVGVGTLSHRNGEAAQSSYSPGEVVDLWIDMPPLLWTLRKGQRLRLEIMSSSFPGYVQHPNVAQDWYWEADPKPAEQTVHILPTRPARLVLQVRGSR